MQVIICGNLYLEVMMLALIIVMCLYGMLIMIINKHLAISNLLVDGQSQQLSNIMIKHHYVVALM